MPSSKWEIREIDSLLSSYLQPGTRILKYEIKQLTAPGENYGSVMQRVDLTIQEPNECAKTLHLVAKRLPANEMLCEIFNVQKTFKIELGMYREVFPALADFEKENDANLQIDDLFARFYGGRINLNDSDIVDEDAVILLENLKILGYEVGDRLVGFDEDHVHRVLEDLAKFHAITIAYRTKKPEEFHKIIYPVIKGVEIAEGFDQKAIKDAVKEVIDVIENIPKCQPHLETVSKAIVHNFSGQCRVNQVVTPFSTLSHTDYWVNNTMILKNEKGKPIKNKLVDFQMPAYCSATRDLIFFLFSSIQPTILYENIDNFLKFYHKYFIDTLKKFDVDDLSDFSFDNFKKELRQNAFVELGHILVMYKPILTLRGAIDDMSNLDMDMLMYQSKLSSDYNSRCADCVCEFIDRKWI